MMTLEEYKEISPGKELDILLAKRVGYTVQVTSRAKPGTEFKECYGIQSPQGEFLDKSHICDDKREIWYISRIPHFSTSVDAAIAFIPNKWELHKLPGKHSVNKAPRYHAVIYGYNPNLPKSSFYDQAGRWVCVDESPAKALMLAYVKMLEAGGQYLPDVG